MPLLEIRNLTVTFDTSAGPFMAVKGIDLSIEEREVLAIVGESGSGKSVAMLAVMGLLPSSATVKADVMRFNGIELLKLNAADRRKIIGKDIAMIFQEPMASLNPCFTVGFQIEEVLQRTPRPRRQCPPCPRHRASDAGRHFRCSRPAQRVPAPDVGRPVPARHDRHRDRLQSEAADRRRADHRARCDNPEADSGSPGGCSRSSMAWA